MPAPEDIPEDRAESFPCPECEDGNVTQNKSGQWECDSCDFVRQNIRLNQQNRHDAVF